MMNPQSTEKRPQERNEEKIGSADLVHRYGRIGLAAVAAAARYPSTPAKAENTAANHRLRDFEDSAA
jgi:hypothetical protein